MRSLLRSPCTPGLGRKAGRGVSRAQSSLALGVSSISCWRWEAAWSSFDSSRRREESWTGRGTRMGEPAPHHPRQDSGFLTYPLLPLCNPL